MEKAIRWAERVCLAAAVLSIVAMMLVTAYDAVSRYLLNAPLPWAFGLVTNFLLIAGLYFAVSSTFAHGDHVHIDMLRGFIPSRVRSVCDAIWGLMAAAAFALIAYGAAHEMLEAYSSREFSPGYIPWPTWISYVPIAAGAALAAVRLLHHAVKLAVRGEDAAVKQDNAYPLAIEGEHSE